MKTLQLKNVVALALVSAGLTSLPAHALQISFSGNSNTGDLITVTGDDGIGDTWQTANGPLNLNSNFAMADLNATPQAFNPSNFSNALGNYATSFQLTINNSQNALGFKGINLGPVGSGLLNHFTVKPDLLDPSSWIAWDATYNLIDSGTGLFQQVLFTAPAGSQLNQGVNFSTNVNMVGIITNDSGFAASFDDRALLAAPGTIPEPGSVALLSAALVGLGVLRRRRTA